MSSRAQPYLRSIRTDSQGAEVSAFTERYAPARLGREGIRDSALLAFRTSWVVEERTIYGTSRPARCSVDGPLGGVDDHGPRNALPREALNDHEVQRKRGVLARLVPIRRAHSSLLSLDPY